MGNKIIIENVSKEELVDIIRSTINTEDEIISTYKAMEILNIKAYKTLKSLFRSGEITAYQLTPNGHPKFSKKEIIEFSKKYKKYSHKK